MNKRISTISLALLAAVVLTTPLLATANAKKTIVSFQNIPVVLTPSPGDIVISKLSGDGHLKITTSQNYQGIYNGPLGIGILYSNLIVSVGDNIYFTPIGTAHSTYAYTLVIEEGPYGAGTLAGHLNAEYEYDLTVSPPRLQIWGNASLEQGTEALSGIRMTFDIYSVPISPTSFLQRQTGEITLPEK